MLLHCCCCMLLLLLLLLSGLVPRGRSSRCLSRGRGGRPLVGGRGREGGEGGGGGRRESIPVKHGSQSLFCWFGTILVVGGFLPKKYSPLSFPLCLCVATCAPAALSSAYVCLSYSPSSFSDSRRRCGRVLECANLRPPATSSSPPPSCFLSSLLFSFSSLLWKRKEGSQCLECVFPILCFDLAFFLLFSVGSYRCHRCINER